MTKNMTSDAQGEQSTTHARTTMATTLSLTNTTQTGGSADKSFTILLVARTVQSSTDTGHMGILDLGEAPSSPGEGGMYLSKASSTCVAAGGVAPKCFQSKYCKLSTLNAGYGMGAMGTCWPPEPAGS